MKICIYGLGAIGGLIAARLAASGQPVSAIARGATLEAVRRDGLRLQEGPAQAPTETRHAITVTDSPAELGVQDVVVVSVKTTALAAIADSIGPLIGPDTTILSTMNGVPWWFFHGKPGYGPLKLTTLDPDGQIAATMPPAQVVGTVTHLSAATPQPGVVRHVGGNGIIVGEPAGGAATKRTQAIVQALRKAGFEITEAESIQQDIWYKLWGNMTMNPVSGITGSASDRILEDIYVRDFMSRCMREAAQIGGRIGIPIEADPEERHDVTLALGGFRTSMLQDVEAGRAVELDALVAAVLEIARQVDVSTPNIDALFGLARLHAQVRGLYPWPA